MVEALFDFTDLEAPSLAISIDKRLDLRGPASRCIIYETSTFEIVDAFLWLYSRQSFKILTLSYTAIPYTCVSDC